MHEMMTTVEPISDVLGEHPHTLVIAAQPKSQPGYQAMVYRTLNFYGQVFRTHDRRWEAGVYAARITPSFLAKNWDEAHDSLTTAKHALERLIDQAYRWMGEATTEGATM